MAKASLKEVKPSEDDAVVEKKTFKKPPVRTERIDCGDYIVEVDGVEYFPHLDEWIDVIPIRQLSDLKNLMKLASAEPMDEVSITDPRLGEQYENLCRYLSDSIYKWNFTDDNEELMPQPYKKPQVIEQLSVEEIGFLTGKLIGGRTDNSKS